MFRPHILIVKPNEDILEELVSYCQRRAQKFIILSAVGAVSCVSTQTNSGTRTYRGHYEIVNLNGFITPPIMGGGPRNTHVTINFSGPDVSLRGGTACSPLIGAMPVQITLAVVPSTMNLELPISSFDHRPAEEAEASEQDATSVSIDRDESFESSSTEDT